MRRYLLATLPSATAVAGWSTSVGVHVTVLSFMFIGWSDSGPELAGPMGQSGLELSVADPSRGVEFSENLSAMSPPSELQYAPQAISSHGPAESIPRTVEIEPPGRDFVISESQFSNTPQLHQDLLLTSYEAAADVTKPDERTSVTGQTAQSPQDNQSADVTVPRAGDDTATSSPPSQGGVGNSTQSDPTFANNSPIIYPASAISSGLEGTVLLRVRIAADGRVENVEIVESSGYAVLDKSAVKSVSRWRAHPARRGGQAIESVIRLPVRFQLR